MSKTHLCNTVQSLRSADGQRGVWSGKREEMEKSYRRNADVTAGGTMLLARAGRKPPLTQAHPVLNKGVNYPRILYLYSVYIYSSG